MGYPSRRIPKVATTGGVSQTSMSYTGQKLDGTGLLFYNARYYDPGIGRFTSADSITPGNGQTLNRYSYVGNNPINHTDPTGHCSSEADPTTDPCWQEYYKVKDKLGYDLSGLQDLMLEQLQQFGNWHDRGIQFFRFSSWTATSLGAVLKGLQLVDNALTSNGYNTDKMLGIGGGNTLTFALGKIDNLAYNGGRSIILNDRIYNDSGQPANYLYEGVIHELGHVVDRMAGHYSHSNDWLDKGWKNVPGSGDWEYYGSSAVANENAKSTPDEDFAETFTWFVLKDQIPRSEWNRIETIPENREDSLKTALGSIK